MFWILLPLLLNHAFFFSLLYVPSCLPMTSKPPTRRLIDVLKQNSKETLDRHSAELAAAASFLKAESIQTRFLRNQFLVNPKSLHLLPNEDLLTRWHVFGLYKPAFCPMRKSAAQDNYHNVSVESFVEAALRSKAIYPTLRRVLRPSEMQVRVLYTLDTFASGPVLVSLSDHYSFATSLATTTMEYDVLVSGHLPVHAKGNHTAIDVPLLFPSAQMSDMDGVAKTIAHYEVRENGYYSVHPVSLLNVVVAAPPSSNPPSLERFAREALGSCVIGDPLVMGELMQLREYAPTQHKVKTPEVRHHASATAEGGGGTAPSGDAAAHAAAVKMAANPHIVSMRGDCDFPRVFTHLREIRVNTSAEKRRPAFTESVDADAAGSGSGGGGGLAFTFPVGGQLAPEQQQQQDAFAQKQGIELHCRKCFEGLVQKQLTTSFKARRIGLLDGTWTPQAEFL